MTDLSHEYKIERFPHPPTVDDLSSAAHGGWRLVSVAVDVTGDRAVEPLYVVYLERPITPAAAMAVNAPEVGAKKKAKPRKKHVAVA